MRKLLFFGDNIINYGSILPTIGARAKIVVFCYIFC
jgi:hypothetical protein